MIERLSTDPALAPGEILVVGCLRNEGLRLPDFLAHHRALGADRFLLIDNASDDGSTEYLLAQDDVCLFHTAEPYSEGRHGVTWANEVLHAHAVGHWALILDVDELFIFPGYERAGLRPLLDWLDSIEGQAMIAPMLDMYPRGSLARTAYEPGKSLIAACPYFDATGYTRVKSANGLEVIHRGGPRQRLFWDGVNRTFPAPVLRKIPLVKWRADLTLEASTHVLRGARLAPTTGLLLHFKFLQDFASAANIEAARREHFMEARQYVAYSDVMTGAPNLSIHWEGSVHYEDSWQLVDLGMMHVPDGYPFSHPRLINDRSGRASNR